MLKPRRRKPDLYQVWPQARRHRRRLSHPFRSRSLIRDLGFAAILMGFFSAGKWLDLPGAIVIVTVVAASIIWALLLASRWQRPYRRSRNSKVRTDPNNRLPWGPAALLFLVVFAAGIGISQWPGEAEVKQFLAPQASMVEVTKPSANMATGDSIFGTGNFGRANPSRTFGMCHTGGGQNCVVDGDTFWMDGVKIRVADIDAPETHPPRCSHEAELGNRATNRLHELLNAGSFELQSLPDRDQDRYGRKLRIVMRNGQSLGDQLTREGLARSWTGRREPWC